MKVALVEPFFSGSHKTWAQSLQRYSSHSISLFTLPGKFWKWRMSGGALPLAEMFNNSKEEFDLILGTSMLDFPTFLSLTKRTSAQLPTALYFHENQLAYPWSEKHRSKREAADAPFILLQIFSALVADRLLFNSSYNRDSFFEFIPTFLLRYPDYNTISIESLKKKSFILPLGLELPSLNPTIKDEEPVVLWNHRWEYDKGPDAFFRTLTRLSQKGLQFKLIVAGEVPDVVPEVFKKAKIELEKHIIHWGYAESKEHYWKLLQQATILPVTSRHDFFGISVMEAIHAGVTPLLPYRLSYPELYHNSENEIHFYKTEEQLYTKLHELVSNPKSSKKFTNTSRQYCWTKQIEKYDKHLSSLYNMFYNK